VSKIRFRASRPDLSVADIRSLREICALGIGELKRRARDGGIILEFHVFGTDWQDDREKILRLISLVEQESVPLEIYEQWHTEEREERLPVTVARQRLEVFRGIELETQMDSDLEAGHISAPGGFEPHDGDWSRERRPWWSRFGYGRKPPQR
jgi:hypothetical protein